ncbi:CAP domain-containing protein [Bacillus alkalicellulosilyticus]|uniref:CAP domain-containing protein n=1 Tax=Alkalihalobacterium alkalicellulosilyticum TaxID=1912214 RepID=UPI001FEAB6F1|nr:CAP domain-containing protein [Bacillus alkalicellulosilyticus]
MTKKMIYTMLLLVAILLGGCNQFGTQGENDFGSGLDEGVNTYLGQISSEATDTPSDEYPHTKAVQVQHAKYEFQVAEGEAQGQSHIIHLPEGSVRLTREQLQQALPAQIAQRLPQDAKGITPERIAQLIPKGTSQLSAEQIANRIRERTKPGQAGGRQQETTQPTPAQPAPEQQETVEQAPAREEAVEQPEQAPAKEETTPTQEEQQQAPPAQGGQAGGISDIESQVIELTNQERRKNGLSDLQADATLANVAREKSNDMQQNNYFSHTSPTYGSPFDMIRDFGVSYSSAAENIAQGQRSAEQVVQAWMNSEGHRANILNGNFTHIGVGYNENGHYWTQMFIRK